MDDKGMFQGNESLETQQEKMLEQINDTISKIDSGEIDDENITAEMLDNATTQLEQAKTIVENAEDVDDLKEARELIHSAIETLGMEPENRHGMEPGPMDDKGMPRDMSNPGMKSINQSSES
jgi:multidrug resistance efflux pump